MDRGCHVVSGTEDVSFENNNYFNHTNTSLCVVLEVMTPVVMDSFIFWDEEPCSSLKVDRRKSKVKGKKGKAILVTGRRDQ
jgi:hypothetical protein